MHLNELRKTILPGDQEIIGEWYVTFIISKSENEKHKKQSGEYYHYQAKRLQFAVDFVYDTADGMQPAARART